jgi:phytoene dehydrogenase-like protein
MQGFAAAGTPANSATRGLEGDPWKNRSMTTQSYDAIIVGGGHNGLVAAAYLGKAGKKVLLLERLDAVGGAAVSAQAFEGVEAWLSRYSYLVSLLPARIIDDLGLDITLVRRRYSSYTPDPADPTRGLLVDNDDAAATAASFARIGAPADEFGLFEEFYEHCRVLTQALWPTMTSPLLTRSEAQRLVTDAGGANVWDAMVEHPIGDIISRHLQNDLVRGVILTDALIGTFARANDTDLQQNICFLYHLIGGGTGDWDVPVGGMGAVSSELARAARDAGAERTTRAEVTAIDPAGTVRYAVDGAELEASAPWILANVAPSTLEKLVAAGSTVSYGREQLAAGEPSAGVFEARPFGDGGDRNPNHAREGAQVKVNLLLKRLPRLRDETVSPEAAFGGTFHINETWTQLDEAYLAAAGGGIPNPLPCEIYCHSLADPTILAPELREAGVQTLTVFGLHVPSRLVTAENNDEMRSRLQAAVLESLNSVLAEPIEDVLLTDAAGRPCIETKTTLDIQRAVGMPGGNIFHGGLDWPFLEDDAPMATPAERWGVATAHPRVVLCGSGARRGGAVSGIGGHNAAMAVLESE